MVKLKDILELTWTVTQLDLDVREPEHEHLIQSYVIGEGCNEENATIHERHRIAKGDLVMIDRKINYHGDKKGNSVESGWGTNYNNVPADLLDMQVIHFRQTSRYDGEGTKITAHITPTGQLKICK